MSRRWAVITIISAICVVIVGAAIGFAGGFGNGGAEPTPGDGEQRGAAAFTPEEVSVVAVAQADGSLAVTETLVFDTPEGSSDPVTWYIGAAHIGWESAERHAQYVVLPTVSDISGVALTDDGPGEALAVETAEPAVDDPLHDNVVYHFAPGRDWSAGRHAVQISYVLDDVHIEVDGADLMVLPLQFARGPHRTVSYRHVDVGDGNAIECTPDNVTFEPDGDCSSLIDRGGRDAESTIAWTYDDVGSVEAIVFATPDVVVDDAQPVVRKK